MIKIGNDNITLKVGSIDVDAVYLGSELVYSGGTPPTPSLKYLANYSNGTSYSADCDSDTTITTAQTKPSGYDFTKMTDCVIGSCITTIGGLAFQAGHLSSVTIMEGVTIIGQEAFEYCAQLTTDIVLPSTITAIGKWAFKSVSPASITCLATTPPTLGTNVFDNPNNCPIYVPSACVNAYKSAWISYSNRIQAIPTPQHDYSKDYLTFRALEDGTFKFSGNSINYSIDSGSTWTELASNTDSPTVQSGDTILWKASLTPTYYVGIGTFSSSGRFEVEGNTMSLLYGDNFIDQTTILNDALRALFDQCSGVTSAENMVLPATTLTERCYQYMFRLCTNLTTAPELPATTLASYCYNFMFNNCTSLTTAPPILPATKLANNCYAAMFVKCTSINSITCLATDISSFQATGNWLRGVASSGTFTKASSMTSWTRGESGIPNGWTVQDYQEN